MFHAIAYVFEMSERCRHRSLYKAADGKRCSKCNALIYPKLAGRS